MAWLPLANVLHRKLRSALCMVAVAIGIAMMVVMLGLSHGTLNEVAQRMQSVPAQLLVLPSGDSVIYSGGGAFSEGHQKLIAAVQLDGRPAVERVIPVYWETVSMGGQKQRIYGVHRGDVPDIFGRHRLVEGRLFDADGRFERAVAERAGPNGAYDTESIPPHVLESGLEVVIDQRLQAIGGYRVGDRIPLAGRTFTIVGVVEAGVVGRVFAPIETLRHISQSGLRKSTMFFVRLRDPHQTHRAAAAIEEEIGAQVIAKDDYARVLFESFAQVYTYINIASGVALVVCFLIILLTMYTLVLERTREIGILRSLGATRRHIVWLSIQESLILCTGGTLLGLALAFAVKQVLARTLPLQSVDLEWRWLLLAMAIGIVGGVASAIYPGYRAARLDPSTALAFE